MALSRYVVTARVTITPDTARVAAQARGPAWCVWFVTLAAGGVTWCPDTEHDGKLMHGRTPDELSEYIEAEAS